MIQSISDVQRSNYKINVSLSYVKRGSVEIHGEMVHR
jgi:hypothetical protein